MEQQGCGFRQLVTFRMERNMFALDVERVHGITDLKSWTPRAGPSSLVRGFRTIGDRQLPVLDLRIRYGMQPATITWRSCLVLTEIGDGAGKTLVGVIADSGGELVMLDSCAIRPAPRLGAGVPASYVSCLATVNDEQLIVLNLDNAISADDLAVKHHEVKASAREDLLR